jgi:transposase
VARVGKRRKAVATDAAGATNRVLRGLARRWIQLTREVAELDAELKILVTQTAPELVALQGVGIDVAGTLLVAAGDNPERLTKEASFAAMCGVSPMDASSGRQRRHRLTRGGNRDANRALWVIALVRLNRDTRTKAYVERRTAQGLSKREIIRCLKRFIAREVFRVLQSSTTRSDPSSLHSVAS